MITPNSWRLGRSLAWSLWLVVTVVVATEPSATAAPDDRFGWPLQPRPAVLRRFDKPPQNWLPGHRGVDLAGAEGQAVLAAGEGIVVFAGTVAGKPVVSLDHPGGLRTTYEPVRADVPVGGRVGRGTRIGTLEAGHPGCAAPCLHWGARAEGGSRRTREYLDPLGLLRLTPLRLKPVRE
ncbi:M23 family metallopeptidase [Nocardia asteroides]